MSRPVAIVAALCAAALLALSTAASAKDYAARALNVIPSGQWGGLGAPAAAGDQAKMYDGLTPLFDQVSAGDLTTYFKPETFGTAGQCPCTTERVPRRGVSIVRDRQNVPHITGRNRLDLDWAAGWVLAQDRALLLAATRPASPRSTRPASAPSRSSPRSRASRSRDRPTASSIASRPPR
jgi:hypothetical protein